MNARYAHLAVLIAVLGIFTAVPFRSAHAEEASGSPARDSAVAMTEKPKSRLAGFAGMSLEKLEEITKKGKEKLNSIIKGDESDLDRSMGELQEIVCAAAERARRLSHWDDKQAEFEAEKAFDSTIEAINAYLDFVKDDGAVHQASKRIRSAALEKERVFREKAESKNSERYRELADAMHNQAQKASIAWEAIRRERKSTEEALHELREYRELYIDVKSAQGIGAAVKELEAVKEDLNRLSMAMRKVQEAVLQEAKQTAEVLSGSPPTD